MIQKLRRKFIILALAALFVLLAVIVAGMNILNYRSVVKEADTTLTILSENGGTFPVVSEERPPWLPKDMSQEILYESRFFSALLARDGEVVYADMSKIYMVDQETAGKYIRAALGEDGEVGFVEDFRYMMVQEEQYTRITFLDCGRKLDLFHDFVFQSILISLIGYVLTAVIICILAGRFVRPVAESYERQKRFITDAGHEIKTPLTIISANVDLLENIYVVIFSPEDLKIVKDGPDLRRRFLDRELCQIKPVYYSDLGNYKKVLKQRNTLLRDQNDDIYLFDVFDEALSDYGVRIVEERKKFIERLHGICKQIHSDISSGKEELETYKKSLIYEYVTGKKEVQ